MYTLITYKQGRSDWNVTFSPGRKEISKRHNGPILDLGGYVGKQAMIP